MTPRQLALGIEGHVLPDIIAASLITTPALDSLQLRECRTKFRALSVEAARLVALDWSEDDHPRGDGGRFASSGGASDATGEMTPFMARGDRTAEMTPVTGHPSVPPAGAHRNSAAWSQAPTHDMAPTGPRSGVREVPAPVAAPRFSTRDAQDIGLKQYLDKARDAYDAEEIARQTGESARELAVTTRQEAIRVGKLADDRSDRAVTRPTFTTHERAGALNRVAAGMHRAAAALNPDHAAEHDAAADRHDRAATHHEGEMLRRATAEGREPVAASVMAGDHRAIAERYRELATSMPCMAVAMLHAADAHDDAARVDALTAMSTVFEALRYDPDQPRNGVGEWSEGGGESADEHFGAGAASKVARAASKDAEAASSKAFARDGTHDAAAIAHDKAADAHDAAAKASQNRAQATAHRDAAAAERKSADVARAHAAAEAKSAKDKANETTTKTAAAATKDPDVLAKAIKSDIAALKVDKKWATPPKEIEKAAKAVHDDIDRNMSKLNETELDSARAFSNGSDTDMRALERGATREQVIQARQARSEGKETREQSAAAADEAAHLLPAWHAAQEKMGVDHPPAPALYRGMTASDATMHDLMHNDHFSAAGMSSSASLSPTMGASYSTRNMGAKDYRGDETKHAVVFRIDSAKGSMPMAHEHLSAFPNEKELVLNRTANYQITNRAKDDRGRVVITMREV